MKLRVMLVDSSATRSAILEEALSEAGYEVAAKVASGNDLFKWVRDVQPDVIIIDQDSPDRDMLEHMRSISRDQPKPIVMFAENSESATIEEAIKAGVSAYIVDGLNAKRVKPIVDVAIARFREYQALREELEKTKTTLAERKLIERAKGILMKQRNLSEEEAYRLLRKAAMENNMRLADMAKNVISVAGLLG